MNSQCYINLFNSFYKGSMVCQECCISSTFSTHSPAVKLNDPFDGINPNNFPSLKWSIMLIPSHWIYFFIIWFAISILSIYICIAVPLVQSNMTSMHVWHWRNGNSLNKWILILLYHVYIIFIYAVNGAEPIKFSRA